MHRKMVAQDPQSADRLSSLARNLLIIGDIEAAERSIKRACRLQPDHTEALVVLAAVLNRRSDPSEAGAALKRALALAPARWDVFANLSSVLASSFQSEGAARAGLRSVRLAPERAEAGFAYGSALLNIDNSKAKGALRRAIVLSPSHAPSWEVMGQMLQADHHRIQAAAAFNRVLLLSPGNVKARLSLCINHISGFHRSESEVASAVSAYGSALDALGDTRSSPSGLQGLSGIGNFLPFYLPYLTSDDHAFQSRYGRLVGRFLSARYPRWASPSPTPRPARDERIRVGFVSAHIYRHSVWAAITHGLVRNMDRRRFALSIYHLGGEQDEETARARLMAERFVQGPRSFEEWVRLLRAPNKMAFWLLGREWQPLFFPTVYGRASRRCSPR